MGRNLTQSGLLSFMTVTASSGSPRVSPQLYDTLPLSSVREAEQQDRFLDGGELNTLVTYTVTFSEDMNASTVTAADFGNAGTSAVTIGTDTVFSFNVFFASRIGRSALRSRPATTQRPSVIANAAGPSHGSITLLQ